MTLGDYVRRRNGVPVGERGSLRNMLRRSIGAGSVGGFWRHWNPVFGYGLGRYVYAPLQGWLPRPLALGLTFVACGAMHDVVTIAARGSLSLFFTPWFLFLGLGVVAAKAARLDYSGRPWGVRAACNLLYLGACLAATLAARSLLGLP